jgi:hypothetical protein
MDVLQIEGHLGWEVALAVARDDLLTHIDQLDVADVGAVFKVFDCLLD